MNTINYDELSRSLLQGQNECSLSWITRDGSPASTIVSYLFKDNALWMTALAGSARVGAISRDNRVSVVITGKGADLGEARCVAMRGNCHIHRDAQTRNWFFPEFAGHVLPDSETGAAMMANAMNTADNLVLQFVPEKIIPYDAQKMMRAANSAP